MNTRKLPSSPTASPSSEHSEEPSGKDASGWRIKRIGLPRRHSDLEPRETAYLKREE